MKLSIITINYNNKVGLEKTIASVMSQTCRDFEWIIIDGGSTDGSKELIESIASNLDTNIGFWCSEKDNGIYNAMNKGISHASGDYLQFLNGGDCYYAKDTLAQVFPYLNDEVADIIYGNERQYNSNTVTNVYYPEKLTLHYLLNRTLRHQSSFIKRTLFDSEGYNERFKYVADWHRFIKFYLDGCSFKYIKIFIAIFDLDGASSNHELVEKEKIEAIRDIFTERYLPLALESREIQEKLNHIHAHLVIENPYLIQCAEILAIGGVTSKWLQYFLGFEKYIFGLKKSLKLHGKPI